jgi:hypothetical protein
MSRLPRRRGAGVLWAGVTGLLGAPVSGCVFSQAYPERWAPLSSIDHCLTVAGRYSQKGEYADPNAGYHSAPALLLLYVGAYPKERERQLRLSKVEWIEISYGEDRLLRIRAFESGEAIAERTYSEDDGTLACTDEGAKILAHRGLPDGGDIFGYSWGATYLRKAGDGSLIVGHRGGVVGLVFMLFPVATSENDWLRFRAKEANAAR